jgi:hypothetical protein
MIVRINGVQIEKVRTGAEFTERITNDFDTANIIINAATRKEPYEMNSQVEIDLDGVTYNYLIADSRIKRISNISEIYQHDIQLVEPTFILSQTMPSHSFTQPVSQFTNIELETTGVVNLTRVNIPLNKTKFKGDPNAFDFNESTNRLEEKKQGNYLYEINYSVTNNDLVAFSSSFEFIYSDNQGEIDRFITPVVSGGGGVDSGTFTLNIPVSDSDTLRFDVLPTNTVTYNLTQFDITAKTSFQSIPIRYTMKDTVERSLKLANSSITLDSGFSIFLDSIKSPQFFIEKPTLFGAVAQECKYVGAIPRMIDFTTLTADFINDLKNPVDISTNTSFFSSKSATQYAQRLETYIENQIPENELDQATISFPSSTGWASVRSDETVLTSENIKFKVPFPIEAGIRLRIKGLALDTTGTLEQEFEDDITDLLFEEEAWNALVPNTLGASGNVKTVIGKSNTLRYQKGGTEIFGFNEKWDLVLGLNATTLNNLLNFVLNRVAPSFTTGSLPTLKNFDEFLFRFEYTPNYTMRYIAERDVKLTNPLTLYSNQQERKIDLISFGNNLNAQVNRLANGDVEVSKRISDFNNRFKIGDFTTDNEICTIAKHRVFNNQIITQGLFTKDFNRIDEFVGINSEIRQFNIPSENVTRADSIIEYCILAQSDTLDDGTSTNDTFVTALGVSTIKSTFDAVISNLDAKVVKWTSSLEEFTQDLVLTCNSSGAGKNLIFQFGFDNVVSAGAKITDSQDGIINKFVRYANEDGTLDKFTFEIYSDYRNPSSLLPNQAFTAQFLPEVQNPSFFNDKLIASPFLIDKDKDPSEILQQNYQLIFVPDSPELGKYVVGEAFITRNGIIAPLDGEQLFLYFSTELYNPTKDNKRVKGDLKTSNFITTTTASGFAVAIDGLPEIDDLLNNYSSWAIGDADGNLYIAVNSNVQVNVFFNFRKVR